MPQTFEHVRYVGKTIEPLSERLSGHLCRKFDTHKCYWIAKLAREGCVPAIWPIAFCSEDGWQEVEKWWIAKLRTVANLTNQSEGGDGGFFQTAEMREKIRQKKMGVKRKPYTKEHIDKIRAKNLGRKRTPEQIEKSASKLRGMKRSPEVCAKFSAAQKQRFERDRALGKSFAISEETKRKMAAAKMGKRVSELAKRKISAANSRPVRCVETGEVFGSVRKAAKHAGVKPPSISRAIIHKIICKGLNWEHANNA